MFPIEDKAMLTLRENFNELDSKTSGHQDTIKKINKACCQMEENI